MKPIGGYFELELRKGKPYHEGVICLNLGRSCFEYILRARGYKSIYLPYYTCGVMFDVPRKLGVSVKCYHINSSLEPDILPELQQDEGLVYTNYFGLKQNCVERLASHYGNKLIVDNSQAFYAPRLKGIDTFYSPRKFFGVPDGGYLYSDSTCHIPINQGYSWQRLSHLSKRIDQSPSDGYQDYLDAESYLNHVPIERMSKLTEAILSGIDYKEVAEKRVGNFRLIHDSLASSNLLGLTCDPTAVPMVYPYISDRPDLRNKLISEKIYIAKYWESVPSRNQATWENELTEYLLPIPIDQRYSSPDLERIIKTILI